MSRTQTPLDTVRRIATDPVVIECLLLVKNGVPFDVAFSLDAETRSAWCIVFAGFEGAQFDWDAGHFKERG